MYNIVYIILDTYNCITYNNLHSNMAVVYNYKVFCVSMVMTVICYDGITKFFFKFVCNLYQN